LQKGTNSSYFGNIKEGIKTSIKGLKLSMRHFKNARKKMPLVNVEDENYFTQNIGTVTLQYPNEVISVPDNGRYRLYNEMDDCIVCDKCAKVCPVDCIDIEPIKSSELIGNASDGSPIRLYAAKFDIDMAKCCFCGLCTTVCPTECLTMTKAYDFSEFEVKDFNYHYANLSPEQADEKKRNYEQFLAEKEAAKAVKVVPTETENKEVTQVKPAFRPAYKKPEVKAEEIDLSAEYSVNKEVVNPKPVFRPVFKKPEIKIEEQISAPENKLDEIPAKPRPVFRPAVKKLEIVDEKPNSEPENATEEIPAKPRPVFRPAVRTPEIKAEEPILEVKNLEVKPEKPSLRPKPVFRPPVRKPKEE
jgi:formate hydrogenlyase subunit 6/NADH:ubiquinone oxidoreductase subunit I